jgi:hypothetical protein
MFTAPSCMDLSDKKCASHSKTYGNISWKWPALQSTRMLQYMNKMLCLWVKLLQKHRYCLYNYFEKNWEIWVVFKILTFFLQGTITCDAAMVSISQTVHKNKSFKLVKCSTNMTPYHAMACSHAIMQSYNIMPLYPQPLLKVTCSFVNLKILYYSHRDTLVETACRLCSCSCMRIIYCCHNPAWWWNF